MIHARAGVASLGWSCVAVLGLLTSARPVRAAAPAIVYLDFSDGTETVTVGATDDSALGRSSIGGASPYPAFTWPTISTGVETRAAVVERVTRKVHQLFLPYNVLITLTRPSVPPYTTVMIGGGPRDIGLDLSFGGVAYMDCGNQQDANLVFAFPTNLRGNEHGLVVTIAQEAAHAFGLEHTMSPRDLMHPLLSPEQASFLDGESAIFDARLCGNSTQNSHLKLLEAVGAWRGDDKPLDLGSRLGVDRTAPTLALAAPAPGATVAQPLDLQVEAEDDRGVDRVVLSTSDGGESLVRRPPYGFALAGFPAGPLRFTLTAYDHSGNSTSLTRDVVVTATPALPTGCGAGPGHPPDQRLPLYVIALGLAWIARPGRRKRGDDTDTACTPRSLPL
jgi:hypothetical protein